MLLYPGHSARLRLGFETAALGHCKMILVEVEFADLRNADFVCGIAGVLDKRQKLIDYELLESHCHLHAAFNAVRNSNYNSNTYCVVEQLENCTTILITYEVVIEPK